MAWEDSIIDSVYGFNRAMGTSIEPTVFIGVCLFVAFLFFAIVSKTTGNR